MGDAEGLFFQRPVAVGDRRATLPECLVEVADADAARLRKVDRPAHDVGIAGMEAAGDIGRVHDAEQRGIRDGDWVRLSSRAGETTLRALITERVAPGVVYTTFHHPDTQANVITTDFSDWATNCPEYKVTAVQVSPSNGPSEWQVEYDAQAAAARRILPAAE